MDRLARALATVVNILDPDVIVLGGGLSNIAAGFIANCRRWWRVRLHARKRRRAS